MPYKEVLLDTEQLKQIVSRLTHEIASAFQDKNDCLALVVMDGAKYFADDLLAGLNIAIDVEYIKASSYKGTSSTGHVTIEDAQSLKDRIRGKNILLIDDIYDTGLTLSHIIQWLNEHNPQSIQTCVLLEKRHKHDKIVNVDFIGTQIEDAFIVGYGLDFNGQYRELPCIGVLSDEIIRQNDPAYKS
mgnify:CR=1 FL=1